MRAQQPQAPARTPAELASRVGDELEAAGRPGPPPGRRASVAPPGRRGGPGWL